MSDRLADGFGEALHPVLMFLPRMLAFGAILLLGWLLARVARRIVDRVLRRVRFDQLVERSAMKAALARAGYDAVGIVAGLASCAVLLVALQLAFGVFGPNPISALITMVVTWLPRAIVALVIVVVAAAVAGGVKEVISSALDGLSYARLLATIASVLIIALGVIAALHQIGVAAIVTTALLIAVLGTVSGVLIVGVGGGLIRPMQVRWEEWLDQAEDEAEMIAEYRRAAQQTRAYDAGRRDAEAAVSASGDTTVPVDEPEIAAEHATVPLGRRASGSTTYRSDRHPGDATVIIRTTATRQSG